VYNVDIIFCRPLFIKYFSGDLMKKDEMGWACGMYGGEDHIGFW